MRSTGATRRHPEWSAPLELGSKPHLGPARPYRSAFPVARPGCAELKVILQQMRFPAPRSRTEAPPAAEIVAMRKAAHKLGHPAAALAHALQFEGTIQLWDAIGQRVPLSYQTPSPIINGAPIDDNLIFRFTPKKTQFTTGVQAIMACGYVRWCWRKSLNPG